MNLDTYMYPASRERSKPFDEQSRMNPKDAAMAKKLIFQHQWGEEALREYQDHVISMVEDHLQSIECKYRPICNTCAAAALLETGDYEGIPEYICEYTKEFYKIMKERR